MPRAGTGRRVDLYDVTRSKIVRSITPNELNHLAAQGLIGWFERKRGNRVSTCACMQPQPMQSRTSNPLRSRVSLVGTDMEMNAEGAFADVKGIGGVRKFGLNRYGEVDQNIVGNRVDQSMSKVEVWPAVYDEKNVTVCAGMVHGITKMSAQQLASL